MSIQDTPGPKGTEKTVMDWSDERAFGNPIMITLARGYAFEDGGPDADYRSAQHVKGFATIALARAAVAIKRLQICDCQRCTGEIA